MQFIHPAFGPTPFSFKGGIGMLRPVVAVCLFTPEPVIRLVSQVHTV
jgi:hypothetical protein